MWSTDREAMDRGQVVRYFRAPGERCSQPMAEEGMVKDGPGTTGTQKVLPASSAQAAETEAVQFTGFQIEPTQASVAAPVNISSQEGRPMAPTGGISNQMRVSPYRCALCDRRFCRNGRQVWQWTRCGGGVWHPSYRRYYHCRAWICRYDDECLKAGMPCPCCKKIKKLQISNQSRTRASAGSSNQAVQDSAVHEINKDEGITAWCDDQGVLHCIHDV